MWLKLGVVFDSQAQLPTVQFLDNNRLRVYYSARSKNTSYINYFETSASEPSVIIYKNKNPILSKGKRGCFDDSGVMPSCVINIFGEDRLYYTGWNTCKGDVPYGHGIGYIVVDDIQKLKRIFEGPIVDRNISCPYLVNSPFVYKNKEKIEMIFCNGNGWIDNFPTYHLSKASSIDGVAWSNVKEFIYQEKKALSRPSVLFESNNIKTWYSMKGVEENYRIFCCTETNKKKQIIKEEFECLKNELWDSEMMCYPAVFEVEKQRYMYYNGNNYGETGIGLAKWV